MELILSHGTPMSWLCPLSLDDNNIEAGMLLEGPGQGQAEKEFMLDANTPFQDLLRSCVTEGTRSQEIDPRCKRPSSPLQT